MYLIGNRIDVQSYAFVRFRQWYGMYFTGVNFNLVELALIGIYTDQIVICTDAYKQINLIVDILHKIISNRL